MHDGGRVDYFVIRVCVAKISVYDKRVRVSWMRLCLRRGIFKW